MVKKSDAKENNPKDSLENQITPEALELLSHLKPRTREAKIQNHTEEINETTPKKIISPEKYQDQSNHQLSFATHTSYFDIHSDPNSNPSRFSKVTKLTLSRKSKMFGPKYQGKEGLTYPSRE